MAPTKGTSNGSGNNDHPGTKVKVDIVSDAICPWCFVGKRRLEKALHDMSPEQQAQVSVEWHPFYLDPSLPREGPGQDKKEMYKMKFGAERFEKMEQFMTELGKKDGINFVYDGKVSNTLNAHRLALFAHRKGGTKLQNDVIEEIFKVYMEEQKDLGDINVLLEAGKRGGLTDEAELRRYLESEEDVGKIDLQVQKMAKKHGIRGVPHFIVSTGDGRQLFSASGAQEVDLLKNVIEEAFAEN